MATPLSGAQISAYRRAQEARKRALAQLSQEQRVAAEAAALQAAERRNDAFSIDPGFDEMEY